MSNVLYVMERDILQAFFYNNILAISFSLFWAAKTDFLMLHWILAHEIF